MKATGLIITILCLTLSGCSNKRTDVSKLINEKASFHGALPLDPFQWRVITTFVNTKESTMSTLYGNDIAVRHARNDPQHPYPESSQLSLVTWYQREDEHWFGAKIPGEMKSIEFITVNASVPTYSYQVYEGSSLVRKSAEEAGQTDSRIEYVLGQRALVMP